ncbi:MAG: EF-P beta-lysylation protein EpmB, partial [Gammaproteobacteria bacterium]|nr:EF-P beta-lysylation protein EpmB [Gammaproteobacteria bacterium]
MNTDWQQQLAGSIKSVDALVKVTNNKNIQTVFSEQADQQFKIKVPTGFLTELSDINSDPLLAQVLPHNDETRLTEGYSDDPVGDMKAMATPGLIHKYKNRALFIVTGACAIHCRYCFRRHFPYA